MSDNNEPREISEDEALELGWLDNVTPSETELRKMGWEAGTYKIYDDFLDRYNADQRIKLGTKKEGDVPFVPRDDELMPLNLANTNWDGVNFTAKNVRFRHGTMLNGASFKKACLTDVCLKKTKLNGVDFTDATMILTNLNGAELYKAKFSRANLYATFFEGAKMQGADLRGAIISDAIFNGADMTKSYIDEAALIKTDLWDETIVDNARLTNKYDDTDIFDEDKSREIFRNSQHDFILKKSSHLGFYATTAIAGVFAGMIASNAIDNSSTEPLEQDPTPTILVEEERARPTTAFTLTQTETICANPDRSALAAQYCDDNGFSEPE